MIKQAVIILFFLIGLQTFALSSQPRTTDWLFIYYMPYDNNMSALGAPILEMIQKGIASEKVIATVQADFSNSGMKRYLILKDTMLTYDIGGEASAHAKTYEQYLDWVKTITTSRKRAIIFLNHGGALDALGYDEVPVPKFLRVDSLRSVLEKFNQETQKKTDLLYLQVCSKASIEPLYELRNSATYTMASQNVLGAPNYYYEKLFNDLSTNKRNELEVARMIVNFERADMYNSITCINNAAFLNTQKRFEEFIQTLEGHLPLTTTPLVVSYYNQIYWDILSFLKALDLLTDKQKQTRARLLDQIRNELIVFHKKEPGKDIMEGYCGLGMVLPSPNKVDDFVHMQFFKDFKTVRLVEYLKSTKAAKTIKSDTRDISMQLPLIRWESHSEFRPSPISELTISAFVESPESLKSVNINVVNKSTRELLGTTLLDLYDRFKIDIYQNILLPQGVYDIEIVAETTQGKIGKLNRVFLIGSSGIDTGIDTLKLKRQDYALLFATDQYDHWPQLVNPIFDARTVEQELKSVYGFETELVLNASKEEIQSKLLEYSKRKYESMDQLFIFFAGHGYWDKITEEGFIVTKQSKTASEGNETLFGYELLRMLINSSNCDHVFIALDVCFGGTFNEEIVMASRGSEDPIYGYLSRFEFITRKLQFKSRLYLTSGGKEYISDGIAGMHSPFVKRFLDTLNGKGGHDGILTTSELYSEMETMRITPRLGSFGIHEPGGDFVFVVK